MKSAFPLFQPASAYERAWTFREIFTRNIWGAAETRSGTGSTTDETRALVARLPAWLDRFGIRSLVDVCGDFNWQFSVLESTSLLQNYVGIDIVSEAIDAARQRFEQYQAQEPRRVQVRFQTCDVVQGDIPRAEAILLRDVLVHLRTGDVFLALDNIRRAGIKFLIATTFPGYANSEIQTGEWRVLNMAAPPFTLGEPLDLLDEANPLVPLKSLGIWNLSTE